MPARVAELVDARDLKSLGYFTCAGSIPASGIKLSLPYGRLQTVKKVKKQAENFIDLCYIKY